MSVFDRVMSWIGRREHAIPGAMEGETSPEVAEFDADLERGAHQAGVDDPAAAPLTDADLEAQALAAKPDADDPPAETS